jgi:hypothetical protein
MKDPKRALREAIQHFWAVREKQQSRQGSSSGKKDYGSRSAVTGGKQLDKIVTLFKDLIIHHGIPDSSIHIRDTTLPGYFRPTKEWDLIVIHKQALIASIEFKSHIGPSFGNNFNNRVEEALGNSTDILAAYREGAFKPSQKPWLGYFMLLEKTEKSLSPVAVREPHFSVFPEFLHKSYQDRYSQFCIRLMREQLYDSACLILSSKSKAASGAYEEPDPEAGFEQFLISLESRIIAEKRKNS